MMPAEGQAAIARAVAGRAIVEAAGIATEYVRVGTGTPLVFITTDVDAADSVAMMEWLSGRFRVLAAAPPVEGADAVAAWLGAFTEGLGVTGAHVLIHSSVSPVLTGEN